MFEGIARLRRGAATIDEIGIAELIERAVQCLCIERRHRSEQSIIKRPPDSSAELGGFFRARQPVQAREQRVLQGGWNCDVGQ